ncbi:MAG: cupin domain-containing protein, partial [Thermoplasmatota archaeon]
LKTHVDKGRRFKTNRGGPMPGVEESVPKSLRRRGLITPPSARYLRGRVVLMDAGEETGFHTASGKEEVLIVLDGAATVYLESRRLRVPVGHSLFIRESSTHNVRNEGPGLLRYVYVRSLTSGERLSSH